MIVVAIVVGIVGEPDLMGYPDGKRITGGISHDGFLFTCRVVSKLEERIKIE